MVGVSGGADSVCLLLLLNELAPQIGFSMTVAHVEHGIRGSESVRDAAFTERLCRNLGIRFELCRVDVPRYREETGLSEEEAARVLRHDSFLDVCGRVGADRIALAHNADDCAETVLFHLARGTGIRGMGGIRPVSEWKDTVIIRPLLCVSRAEIEDWITARGQEYCRDSTNADEIYTRNRIRRRVMPELAGINDRAVFHIQSTAGQMAEICDYLDEAAWKAGKDVFFLEDGTGGSPRVTILCEPFREMHVVLQKHLILLLLGLAAGSRKDITSVHVEQVMRLMTADVGAHLSLPCRITARKTYEKVVLGTEIPNEVCFTEQNLKIPGETVTEDGIIFMTELMNVVDVSKKIPRKSYTKWFDYDKINHVVCLRTRRPGDYIVTDADGGHKKLNKYFIDEKVPVSLRDRIWLLADGNHIMWVVGYRISEACKVSGQTRRILCVEAGTQNTKRGEDTDG